MDKELIVVKGKVIEQQRSYTADIGKDIGYEAGAKMIKRHFDENPDDMIAHFIGKNILQQILSQPECTGIRAFYALNELGLRQLVLVGVNSKGNNILMVNSKNEKGEVAKHPGTITITCKGCPPNCGGTSEDDVEETSTSWS